MYVKNYYAWPEGVVPASSYLSWISAKGNDISSYFYFLIFPFLAALPYSGQLHTDIHSGYYELAISKSSKYNYYISMIGVNVIAGFIVVSLPVLINFYLHCLSFKAIPPHPALYYGDVVLDNQSTLFYELFQTQPLLTTLIYIVLFGLVGSMMALTALASSLVIKKKIIIYAVPFIYQLLLSIVPSLVYSYPGRFLQITGDGVKQSGVGMFFFITILLCLLFYLIGKRKNA
jgi:hypothetical protein